MTNGLRAKVRRMRPVYAVNAVTSMVLGLWTLVHPSSFWGTIGISGSDPIVQAIYGGAICGEGIISALGFSRPLRYVAIFQYMMAYKLVVCLGLIPRLLLMDAPPIAAWIVVGAWAIAGVQSAAVYPWGRWREIVAALGEEE